MPPIAEGLPDDPETLKAMLIAERIRSERLVQIIKDLQRHRFGSRAESLPADQLLLALEDVEQSVAESAAEADVLSPAVRAESARKRRVNRGALPTHLPRLETVVDVKSKICSCCRGELHRIGEDVSEKLDVAPAQFRVLVVRRPKYACRACEDVIVQAPAPARLIEGGLPTEATVAHVIVSKYADHLPLYRQAQIYERQGLLLDRSTLADWVGRAAFHLRPIRERILACLRSSAKLFADETTAPVLDPGRGRTKIGQLWTYVSLRRGPPCSMWPAGGVCAAKFSLRAQLAAQHGTDDIDHGRGASPALEFRGAPTDIGGSQCTRGHYCGGGAAS